MFLFEKCFFISPAAAELNTLSDSDCHCILCFSRSSTDIKHLFNVRKRRQAHLSFKEARRHTIINYSLLHNKDHKGRKSSAAS